MSILWLLQCPEWCDGSRKRKYFHVLENAYEGNTPVACPLLPCVPPNCCCPGFDCIGKQYFDRGVYDQQDCSRSIGCVAGAPYMVGEARKFVCFCTDCPHSVNICCDGMCCDPCFGERVRIVPFETCCFCCSTRASACTNYCGLCGPKSGEPTLLFGFLDCLETGEGLRVMEAFNNGRQQWSARTGIN